jgi:hypothetical protein
VDLAAGGDVSPGEQRHGVFADSHVQEAVDPLIETGCELDEDSVAAMRIHGWSREDQAS